MRVPTQRARMKARVFSGEGQRYRVRKNRGTPANNGGRSSCGPDNDVTDLRDKPTGLPERIIDLPVDSSRRMLAVRPTL